jgi:FkbM family methyltransferase
MIKSLKKIIGSSNFSKLEQLKKAFLPTKYDKEQLKFFKEQLQFYSNFIKIDDLCFDVGGNIGEKARVFLKLGAKVVIIEPQKNCVDMLKNRFGSEAIILQKGVGAIKEIKDFYISNNSQLSSFNKNWLDDLNETRFVNSKVQMIEKIEIITLDSLINTYGVPSFIKIDVEGYELEVIKGLSKQFNLLSFEFTVPERLDALLKILDNLNQKFSNLKFNFSTMLNSSLELEEWVNFITIKSIIKDESFSRYFAGDMYVKNINFQSAI